MSHGPRMVGGAVVLLALFFLLRGRIRIEKGWAGFAVVRFSAIERFAHWLLATSFIALALTGLTVRYGRGLLLPLLGHSSFTEVLRVSKALHGKVAFAFMLGLVLAFVLWVRHSLPHWRDPIWLLKGGGMVVRGVNPAAWKLNLGQKLLFWLTILVGVLLSITGLALLLPWTDLLAKTLAGLSTLGLPVPTADKDMQLAAVWHGALAWVLIGVTLAHAIIRTVGVQGAFAAMGSGRVDANWARQHHSLWAERELKRMGTEAAAPDGGKVPTAAPAE
ncbi:MAG: formate dehydrogenase subunit gamma [Hyphomonadaceae bacterium]|nr:formate dehydrogenase subunit gamma [Hyphomonadaceae bacterium]